MGFRLSLKWGFSPFSSTNSSSPSSSSSSWPSSYSYKGREIFSDAAKISLSSVVWGESETLGNDPLRAQSPFSALETTENSSIDDELQIPTEGDTRFLASLQAAKASQFGQLMTNLNVLEQRLTDSDAIRLERDILLQIEKLGALELFHKCLSRTLNQPNLAELSDTVTNVTKNNKLLVPFVRRERRRTRRKRASNKGINNSILEFHSKSIFTDPVEPKFPSGKKRSKSRVKKWKVARNEAEMSRGVKLLAELERIRTLLEEESGQVVSLSIWAEAAGVEIKVLQKHLHFGWYCRDQLLRSTRSLVVYLARNYRGLGVAFEDLIQAGNVGVLQGAERFDHTRGYKFSTYVHYWIRKSISMLVARHSRGIRVPVTISNAINKIHRARKALQSSHGKMPDDSEIAKFTGLSISKVTSASQCLRVVGSVDQKMGDGFGARFMEFLPDESIATPEETVMRQHMMKDIYELLQDLEPRERQVLILRFGIGNNQCRSLEEIGRLLCVSKEWIRKIESTALTKLRNEDSLHSLSRYLYI